MKVILLEIQGQRQLSRSLYKSKIYPCGIFSLTIKTISVLSVQCGKLIHGSVGVERVSPKISRNLTCRKCEGNIGETVEQEVKLCDEVKAVR